MSTLATKLATAAKSYLQRFKLKHFIGEPQIATLSRALVDQNGNLVFEADGRTLTGIIESKTLKKGTVTTLTGATDAIDISLGDIFILNRTSAVDAATLADPGAADEGRTIWIKNGTTQANTITITSGLGGSGASYDVITFTNVVAANVTLRAYGTKWYLVGQHLAAVA